MTITLPNSAIATSHSRAAPHPGGHRGRRSLPAGRGGRLHSDRHGHWSCTPGFEHHPAYWVTWIGAAAFAALAGARLPTRSECDALTADAPRQQANVNYRHGDVTHVLEQGLRHDEIHHRVGNVQIWCADGPHPDELLAGPASR
jgi:hypothetical protein